MRPCPWPVGDCPHPNACKCADNAEGRATAPATADDAEIMRLWRDAGLPEYFLGNGGTNHKLCAFAALIRAEQAKGEDAVAEVVPCYTPSGKRVALHTAHQSLPIGTKLYTHPTTDRADAIRECITLIEVGFDRGIAKKTDTCAHGRYGWEDCEQCAVAALRALLDKETPVAEDRSKIYEEMTKHRDGKW